MDGFPHRKLVQLTSATRSFRTLACCGLSGLVQLKIPNCQIVYESVHFISPLNTHK